MDEKDKGGQGGEEQTPEQLQEQIKALSEEVGSLKKTAEEKAAIETELAETRAKLNESENARREQGKNFKKLRDLTEADKQKMTQAELDLMARTEALEEQKAKDDAQRQVDQKERLLDRVVGQNPQLREAVAADYEIMSGNKADPKVAEDLMKKAARIHGIGVGPNELHQAHNASGIAPKVDNGGSTFADTSQGKSLAANLGLEVEKK